MSQVRVLSTPLIIGGWRGELSVEGDLIKVAEEGGERRLTIDAKNLKRTGFNSNNGLWVFSLKDGGRVRLQSAGLLLSADRTAAGRDSNTAIRELLLKHNVKGLRL